MTRLGVYAAALALMFAGAWGLGRAVGPVGWVGPASPAEHGDVGQHSLARTPSAADPHSSIFASSS